jgi:hypothetical protein
MTRSSKWRTFFRWLVPGMRVKRWGGLALLGVLLILIGAFGLTHVPGDFSQIITVVYYAI